MEQDRFDALAISLADEGASRRSVLGRIAAGGVAAALGITAFTAFEDDDADAKKRKKGKSCKQKCNRKKNKSKRKKCKKNCPKPCTANSTCAGGQLCVNGLCASTCSSNAQCGSGQACLNGACTTACTTDGNCGSGQVCVNGGCANGCTSNANCTGDQRCINGVCGIPSTPPAAAVLCPTGTCPGGSGLICAAGVCVLGCTADAECSPELVCGNLLGLIGPKVCLRPSSSCGPQTPCTGDAVTACVLGICVEVDVI